MEEGERQTIVRQRRMAFITGGLFTSQEMEGVQVVQDPHLKINRAKKYLPAYAGYDLASEK